MGHMEYTIGQFLAKLIEWLFVGFAAGIGYTLSQKVLAISTVAQ